MGLVTQNGSALNVLKERYPMAMYNSLVQFSDILDIFKEKAGKLFEGPDGKGYFLSSLIGGLQGIGARLENEALPIADPNQNIRPALYLKYNYAGIETTWQALKNLDGGAASMGSFNEAVIFPQLRELASDLDRQACGAGTGVLCRVDDAAPSTTLGLDAPFGLAANTKAWTIVRRGMSVVFGPTLDGSGLRSGGQVSKIISVNPLGNAGGGTVTLDSIPADVADDDYVFRGDAAGNNTSNGGIEREMMGLEGLVDDGTNVATLQNIDRNSVFEFRSTVIDATQAPYSNAFTSGLAMRIITDAQLVGNGKVDTILCNNDVWRQVIGALGGSSGFYGGFGASPDRGGANVTLGAKGVNVALPSGSVNVRGVPRTAVGRVYGLDSSTLIRCKLGDGDWVGTEAGGMWHQVRVGSTIKDALFAQYRIPQNLGITDPRKNTKATGVSEVGF